MTDRPADYIGDEALARVREYAENARVTPSTHNRVAYRFFGPPPDNVAVLEVFGPSATIGLPGPRLVAVRMTPEGKLTAEYDPADLDDAARAFVQAIIDSWGPMLAAYLAGQGQVSRSQVMPSNHNS